MLKVLELIRERRSDRVPFDEAKKVADEDLRQILEACRWAPTAHNMQNFQVVVVDDRILVSAIAAIRRPISPTFVRENYQQLSFSEEELQRKKVGLLGTMFPAFMRTLGAPMPAEGSPFLPCPVLDCRALRSTAQGPCFGRRLPGHHEPGVRHGKHVAHRPVSSGWDSTS